MAEKEFKSAKVLVVDDDENVLSAFKRLLRSKYNVQTANTPVKALLMVKNQGPFSVVITDMHMPNVDGVSLLNRLKIVSPDTVRMLLTGDSSINVAIEATNSGEVFRYLQKPCPPDQLSKALEAGIKQYRLVTNEREILEKTLKSCIKMLVEMLSMISPLAFRRSRRIHFYMLRLVETLKIRESWDFEIAAMLSQIGFVSVPEEIVRKYYAQEKLSLDEHKVLNEHPDIGHNILAKIPRLETVAQMVGEQDEPCHRTEFDDQLIKKHPAKAGAMLLMVINEYDRLLSSGKTKSEVIDELGESPRIYAAPIVELLNGLPVIKRHNVTKAVNLTKLIKGMVLADDIVTEDGGVIASEDTFVNEAVLQIINNYLLMNKISNTMCKVFINE